MGALDFYWVEHREDPGDTWARREPLPAGWTDAVDQLRQAAEAALEGADDADTDEVAAECREFLRAIGQGRVSEATRSSYTGRYLRIVRASPVLTDPMAAELCWWVIHNADDLAAVTITTDAGQTIDGTLAWEDIDAHAVSITVGGRTTVLRPERIESFTLDPSRHPTTPPS
jgi:hypothetical protein